MTSGGHLHERVGPRRTGAVAMGHTAVHRGVSCRVDRHEAFADGAGTVHGGINVTLDRRGLGVVGIARAVSRQRRCGGHIGSSR